MSSYFASILLVRLFALEVMDRVMHFENLEVILKESSDDCNVNITITR